MNKFSLKTIVTTLIGTGIVGSLVALPIRASEDNLIEPTSNLILSQVSDGERNYTEPSGNFKNIIGLTGLAIGTGVVGYYLTRAYKLSLANSLPTVNNSSTSLLTRVSPKLRRELLRLVHDRQTADRLLFGTFNTHRDRSANWLAEKVIYDLKRDR